MVFLLILLKNAALLFTLNSERFLGNSGIVEENLEHEEEKFYETIQELVHFVVKHLLRNSSFIDRIEK